MAEESQNQVAEQAPSDDDVLASYEEMFKHRYTDRDAEYVKTLETPMAPPPCVENWFSRPKRSFDWTRNSTDQRQDNRNHDYHNRHGNEGYGNRGYNDYGRNRDYNRERYQSGDNRQGGNGDHGDRYGEHHNKYRRGNHGRGGYRH